MNLILHKQHISSRPLCMDKVLLLLSFVFFSGCSTLTQSSRVVENIDCEYLALEAPTHIEVDGEQSDPDYMAYLAFPANYYVDQVGFKGEGSIRTANLKKKRPADSPWRYLKVDLDHLNFGDVFEQLRQGDAILYKKEQLPAQMAKISLPDDFYLVENRDYSYHYSTGLNVIRKRGYPIVVDSKRGIVGHLLAPTTMLFGLTDCMLTVVVAVPIAIVMAPVSLTKAIID